MCKYESNTSQKEVIFHEEHPNPNRPYHANINLKWRAIKRSEEIYQK